MKKIIRTLLFALLAVFCLMAYKTADRLPSPPEGIAQDKYEGWSGVLRLWVYTDWQTGTGSLTTWLNDCIARFEKGHSGVYIQTKSVSAQTMAAFAQGEVNPPDLIVFSPGALDSADCLFPLEGNVLPGLNQCGMANGSVRAIPVAMGGYAWAYNSGSVSDIVLDEYRMRVCSDGEGISAQAALIALCAGTNTSGGNEEPRAGTGMDLGLPTAVPSPLPSASLTPEENGRALPVDFAFADDAYNQFLREEADVILATQRELCRLTDASDAGASLNWAVETGKSFTDQLALFAIVDWSREDIDARRALGEALLAHLLKEESQARLTRINALRTTPGDALYSAQSAMARLEAGYLNTPILAPNAFDTRWQKSVQTLFSLFSEERISAGAAYAELSEELGR